jgi:hypothetical protein
MQRYRNNYKKVKRRTSPLLSGQPKVARGTRRNSGAQASSAGAATKVAIGHYS